MPTERVELANREAVPDELMQAYRVVMASIWFPGDPTEQKKYVDLPGQAPMGNVTESLCLLEDGEVIGTAALYGFSDIRNRENIKYVERLKNLPDWLTQTIYKGDLSLAPKFQGQGMASKIVDLLKDRAFDPNQNVGPERIIGITESTNKAMIRLVHNTGGNVVAPQSYHFVKLPHPNDVRPNHLQAKAKFTTQPFYLDEDYPPVIHLFRDDKNEIQAGTIATSPNMPGVTSAQPTGHTDDLFPNQCVGIINPEMTRAEMNALLPVIYNAVGRYKYVNLFQRRENDGNYMSGDILRNGFRDGWRLYEYSKKY